MTPTRSQVRCRACRRLHLAASRCPHCPRTIGTQQWTRLSRKLILDHIVEHGDICRGLTWSEDPHGTYRRHDRHKTSDLVTHHLNQDQSDWRPENLTVICRALNSALG